MSIRRDVTLSGSPHRDGLRPRSPAEALEPGRAPPRPKGVKQQRPQNKTVSSFVRVLSGLLTLSLAIVVTSGAVAFLVERWVKSPGPLEKTRVVAIPKGGCMQTAERLEKEGVIRSQWIFNLASKLGNHCGDDSPNPIRSGDFEFTEGASVRDVLDTLVVGKSVQTKVTIVEGLTSLQVVEKVKADPNLSGDVSEVPAEGALYPDTYLFSKGRTRQELIDQMLAKQREILASEWERRAEGLPFSTPEQALVLASIVEKETGKADERERVAAVFVNRLKKNMRLESDPTILYGIYGGAVQWGKPILKSEIDAKNAHNTYEIKGLPPTPICNPGRASIAAVLNPAATDEIYFVADGTGGHIFSTNLKDHNAAVAKWRKAEKEIRANEKEAKAKEPGEPKAGAEPAPPAVATGAPPAKAKAESKTDPAAPKPGQRAVVRTVPPAAGDEIPSPPAEQPAKAKSAAPASGAPSGTASGAGPVKTLPATGAAGGSPVKTVNPAPAAGGASGASPVKTVPATEAKKSSAAKPAAGGASGAPAKEAADAGAAPPPVAKPKAAN